MARSNETKLAEQITAALEGHYFNSAILARLLMDDPIWTIDRLVEMLAHIVHYLDIRYTKEWEAGQTSEGLLLATELNETLKQLTTNKKYENIILPM
jgi:hypothetical protein